MKIAVLILAHKNLEQLGLLIDHLKQDFKVYVHINKLVKNNFKNEDNVRFIEERYIPYWGSSNTPRAVLALIKEAYKDECDYYMVISGQDLPVMKNKDLISIISQNPVDYIYHHKIPNASWSLNGGLDRLSLYWPYQFDSKNIFPKICNAALKAVFGLIRKLQLLTGLKRKIRFDPWGGSMWLNINKESAQYIIEYIDRNPDYMSRFRYTRLSDEILFHSILLGTPFKNKTTIVNDDMRYIDWESGPQYPKIFTMEDIERCLNSGKFFARKFDENIDENVIKKILARSK